MPSECISYMYHVFCPPQIQFSKLELQGFSFLLKMSSSSTANSSDTVKRGSLFSRIFSVSDQFVNYYYYHQSPTNQMIHFVFVPVIALSLIMLCFKVDLQHVDTVRWLIVDVLKLSSEWCNLAVLVSAVLMVYYLILDRIAGVSFRKSKLGQFHKSIN